MGMNRVNAHTKKVLTWHIHGNYLYYLTHTPHIFYLPVKPGNPEGYCGRTPNFDWGENVVEIPADQIQHRDDIDLVLYQSVTNYRQDQYEILSPDQQRLPRLYLEHNAPQEHPTDTRHPATDDPNIPVVHVTGFNRLMWDSGENFTYVVEHGVRLPEEVPYTGEMNKGLVIVNNIHKRGRRLGLDILERARKSVPLDLIGMNAEEAGGLGEIPYRELPAFMSRYRFLFVPMRYSSLSLALCEAMILGLPVVGIGTTELPTIITNGVHGYIHTDVDYLVGKMRQLLDAPEQAMRMSHSVRQFAASRFGIRRFAEQWRALIEFEVNRVTAKPSRKRDYV